MIALLSLALLVAMIAATWRMYAKAGQPGWGCLIPIYGTYLWLKIAGKPGWWLLLLLIPLVNVVLCFVACIDLARRFGQSTLFGVGLFFLAPLFTLILGFGDARYQAAEDYEGRIGQIGR